MLDAEEGNDRTVQEGTYAAVVHILASGVVRTHGKDDAALPLASAAAVVPDAPSRLLSAWLSRFRLLVFAHVSYLLSLASLWNSTDHLRHLLLMVCRSSSSFQDLVV